MVSMRAPTTSSSTDEETSRKSSVGSVVKERPSTGATWVTRLPLNMQGKM